ncbi:MAG: hypothetical protein KKD35_06005, partial [Elusimicrobia bacterium]|nr:hypothetical protein [Elusimicrobiota bacterium]
MNILIRPLLLTILFSLPSITWAQENESNETIEYSISPSTSLIKLAEPFKITFEINKNSYSKNLKIDTATQNTEPFEILSITELVPKKEDPFQKNKKLEFNIIPFDIGIATFPVLSWTFQNEEGKLLKIKSPAITLNILPYTNKEGKDVLDIHPPFEFFSLWKTLLIFFLIVLIIMAIIFIVKKKSARIIQRIRTKRERTPYQKAMENIRILSASKLWTEGKQKKFYIRLSDILRIYIMDELSITAPLMTTNTLLKTLKADNKDIELLIKVKELLQFSDLVKFAKLKPTEEERDLSLTASKEIIDRFHSYQMQKEKALEVDKK